jgi:hypothetical protein
MISYYIVAFFFAIIVIVYWARQNDAVPLGERTKGLLRMKFTEKSTVKSPDRHGETASSQRASGQPGRFSGSRRRF